LIQISDLVDEISNDELYYENAIHEKAISGLAELTAAAMELYYKLGEMLMIDTHNHQQVIVKAEHFSL